MIPPRGIFVSLFMRLMAVARYRYIIELLIIFIGVWCSCALLVFYMEVNINPRVRTPLEAVYLMLVTMMTSGDSAVLPTTTGGRLVMSVALILSKLLTALLCALAAAVLIDRKLKDEMGLKMHTLKDHIVLIGWNLKGTQLISTLRNDPKYHSKAILVMADTDHKPTEDPLVYFTRAPYPIRGDAIERASLLSASTVIILANYAERHHADALTAVSCLMVKKSNPTARVIAELLNPNQRIYLESAGADAIVSIADVGGFLLAEATIGTHQAQQLLDYVSHPHSHESS